MNVRMFAMIGVLATTIAVRGDEPAQRASNTKPMIYELNLGIYSGAPLGDRDAGELTGRVEATLAFEPGAPAAFLARGQILKTCVLGGKMVARVPVDVLYALDGTARPGVDGRISLDSQVTLSEMMPDGSPIRAIQVQCTREMHPNEPLRRKLGVIDDNVTWIELQVRRINNFPTH